MYVDNAAMQLIRWPKQVSKTEGKEEARKFCFVLFSFWWCGGGWFVDGWFWERAIDPRNG